MHLIVKGWSFAATAKIAEFESLFDDKRKIEKVRMRAFKEGGEEERKNVLLLIVLASATMETMREETQ